MTEDAIATVVAREQALLDHAVRHDRAALDDLLDPAFVEVGASGRRWTRSEIIHALVEDPDGTTAHASDFAGTCLSDTLVLLTYVSTSDSRRARRASLWRLEHDRWRLLYHQGTPSTC